MPVASIVRVVTLPDRTLALVRDRVLRHGRLSAAYQILNPDFDYWLDDDTDSVAGFVRRGGWWAVGGGPICPVDREDAAVARIEAAARRDGCRVVYVCADETLRHAADRLGGHSVATFGAEPVWNPADWWRRPKESPSLRQQLNRARNKGVVVTQMPSADIPGNTAELKSVVADWLTTRPLPPMRFLNDPHTLDGVTADRRVWVARRNGAAVAFLLASPVTRRGGYLFEQIARRPGTPNGTVELLIDHAMRDIAADGCVYATLGLVVLASHVADQMARAPMWLRLMFAFSRAHGRRFYNYDGLARFREKLRPDAWEPMHFIANTRPFPFSALYAAGAAFCGDRSPLGVVSRGLGKAVATEVGWASGAVLHAVAFASAAG